MTAYREFCLLRDQRRAGEEAPQHTEAYAFDLAILNEIGLKHIIQVTNLRSLLTTQVAQIEDQEKAAYALQLKNDQLVSALTRIALNISDDTAPHVVAGEALSIAHPQVPPATAEPREKSNTPFTHQTKEVKMDKQYLFVTTPAITLPNGVVVQPFSVGQYLTGAASNHTPVITADAVPLVEINFVEAQQLAAQIDCKLITELQYLAIAHDIANQDINWTGGKVGEGNIYQGLHMGTVDEAQPGNFVSDEAEERRWHELSNGERIFDFSGNVYSWVYDDVQGDEKGLIAKPFTKNSPSITTAQHPSMTKGMGWRPEAGTDWSGYALVRGGCWHVGDDAGVFLLYDGWPDYRGDYVGFRCTK